MKDRLKYSQIQRQTNLDPPRQCSPAIPIRLAFASQDSTPRNDHKDSEYRFQYRQIGRALLLCEQKYLQVGIPWVWASKRFPFTGFNPTEPLEDFVKVQMVGIKTKVLYSYENDLRTSTIDSESSRALHLHDYHPLSRYASALALSLLCWLIGMLVLALVISKATVSCAIASWFAALFGLFLGRLCTERQRRLSFARVITIELMRRKGQGPNTKSPIPLFSAGEPIG